MAAPSTRHALLFVVETAAAGAKNYYSGGASAAQRLTRGIGWVALVLVVLGL